MEGWEGKVIEEGYLGVEGAYCEKVNGESFWGFF